MSALADMLAGAGGPHGADGEDGKDMADGEGGDHRMMGVSSLKAMFEAAKAGDFDAAYDHLCAAMEHAENTEYPDKGDGEMGGGMSDHPKPMLEIQIGHHKR